jgi:hypothetical protein
LRAQNASGWGRVDSILQVLEFNKYEVVTRQLGSGGFAIVALLRDPDGKLIVLKIPRLGKEKNLRDEGIGDMRDWKLALKEYIDSR